MTDAPVGGGVQGRILVSGSGSGPLLPLRAPISFWGGVDPRTAHICDPRHPDHGADLKGRVVWIPGTVGSSSSSSILLELIRGGRAPAAIILERADPILALGAIVARELGYPPMPMIEWPEGEPRQWTAGTRWMVSDDGRVHSRA